MIEVSPQSILNLSIDLNHDDISLIFATLVKFHVYLFYGTASGEGVCGFKVEIKSIYPLPEKFNHFIQYGYT